jgi:phosphoglycerate dehydrogenase-like enzyme
MWRQRAWSASVLSIRSQAIPGACGPAIPAHDAEGIAGGRVKTLVHNLGRGFNNAIQSALPAGWHSVVAESHWDLRDSDALFVVHDTRDPDSHRAAAPPPGWPGRTTFVQLASSGLQAYPEWLFEVPQVASARGTSAPPIAEYVLTAMLAHEKRVPELWIGDAEAWAARRDDPKWQMGTLEGRTLGLIGVGAIGSRVAALARPFGMQVIAVRRSSAPEQNIEIVGFDDLLARADHLVVAAPLTAETTGLLDSRAFARAKRGVHLVNVARGPIIDQEALIAALNTGIVAAATLDVTDPEPLPDKHPLYSHPRVRISPHIAWKAAGFAPRLLGILVDNLRRIEAGEQPVNPVTLGELRNQNE